MKTCRTCHWHQFEPIDRGFVCVNADSNYCAEWTEEEDSCERWEGKENDLDRNGDAGEVRGVRAGRFDIRGRRG